METINARDAGVRAVSVARAIGDRRTLLRALLAYHDCLLFLLAYPESAALLATLIALIAYQTVNVRRHPAIS